MGRFTNFAAKVLQATKTPAGKAAIQSGLNAADDAVLITAGKSKVNFKGLAVKAINAWAFHQSEFNCYVAAKEVLSSSDKRSILKK